MNSIASKINELIRASLSKIGIDGITHILICQNLVLWLSKFMPEWLVVIVTIVIFVMKELYDKYYKKTEISTKDLFCDCGGMVLGVLILIV